MGRNKRAEEAKPKVLRLGMVLDDELVMQKALEVIRSFPGVDDCNVKMRTSEIEIIGSMDPAKLVEELQKITTTEILCSDKHMEATRFLGLKSARSYFREISFSIQRFLNGGRGAAGDSGGGNDNGGTSGNGGSEEEGGHEKGEEGNNNENNEDDKKQSETFDYKIPSTSNFQHLRAYQQWTKNSRRVKILMLCFYFRHRQHRLTAPPPPPPPPADVL